MFHMSPAYYSTDTEQHTGEFVHGVIFLHRFLGESSRISEQTEAVSDGVLKYIKLISFQAQICKVEKWNEKTCQKNNLQDLRLETVKSSSV